MDYLAQIDKKKTPVHVAIIMDGNGRWAKKQGHERLYGHNFGVESVREVLKASTDRMRFPLKTGIVQKKKWMD